MFKIRPAWVLVCHASYVAFCHRAAESPISLPPCSFAALAAEIFVGNIVQCVSKLDNQWKKKTCFLVQSANLEVCFPPQSNNYGSSAYNAKCVQWQ